MRKRLQHRLINVNLKTIEDNNIEHKDLLMVDDERQRLKCIFENTFQNYHYNVLIARVLFLYINDYDITKILEETKLSKNTICNYINHYKEDKLFMHKMYRRPKQSFSKLEFYQYKIADDFETSCIKTYKEAQEII